MTGERSPVLSLRGAAICLAAAILLLWPMTLVTVPLVHYDSFAYADMGREILAHLFSPRAFDDAGSGADGQGLNVLRSPAWSVYLAGLGGLPWGAVAACALQTAATLFVLGALVPAETAIRRWPAVAGALAVAALSALPWYASYAMPDLLGALVIAYYAALAGALEREGRAIRWTLGGLATFAILSHYGNLPLAAALAVLVMLVQLPTLNARRAVAAFGPLAIALAFSAAIDIGLEHAAGEPTASETGAGEAAAPMASADVPRRLPILLARSIQDGPALWHLRDACARDVYRSCALLDPLPETVGEFLWSESGMRGLTDAEQATVRSEQWDILFGAVRAYPVAQATATMRNTALQLVRMGTGQIMPFPPIGPDGMRQPVRAAERDSHPVLRNINWPIRIATALAGLALVLRIVTGRTDRRLVLPAFIILAGLLVNAAIFGGLSYPVDRYQGRLAWLVPALLALDLALAPKTRAAGRRGQAGFAGGRAKRAGIV